MFFVSPQYLSVQSSAREEMLCSFGGAGGQLFTMLPLCPTQTPLRLNADSVMKARDNSNGAYRKLPDTEFLIVVCFLSLITLIRVMCIRRKLSQS